MSLPTRASSSRAQNASPASGSSTASAKSPDRFRSSEALGELDRSTRTAPSTSRASSLPMARTR
ncbi:hypothetical protein ACFPRL_30510 [Pseudoclavibacter helvolus]